MVPEQERYTSNAERRKKPFTKLNYHILIYFKYNYLTLKYKNIVIGS